MTMPRRLSYLAVLSSCVILLGTAAAPASNWYVSPSGSSSGNGSITSPWDITTAFNGPAAVKPGDTVWLRGGTYLGNNVFYPHFTGTATQPITIRQYPGERATLKGNTVWNQLETLQLMYCTYVNFWGFEITSSVTNRVSADYAHPYSWPTDIDIAGGMTTTNGGSYCKLINIVIHDCAGGIGGWVNSVNFEGAGCLIYFNGWQGPDRGHGHGNYSQNNTGIKWYHDNIIFANFDNGTQAYGTGNTFTNNFTFDHDIWFEAGVLSDNSTGDELIIGGGNASSGIIVCDNNFYRRSLSGTGMEVGYVAGYVSVDANVQNNYCIAGSSMNQWQTLTYRNNTVAATTSGVNPTAWNWDYNTYYCTEVPDQWNEWQPFYRLPSSLLMSWTDWRTNYPTLDVHSTYTKGMPTALHVFVHANPYESGRGNIAVYNWPLYSSVAVDVSSILTVGSSYVVQDVQNFFGSPVASGTYAGGTINIPMTSTTAAQPAGNAPVPYVHTPQQFGAFIVLSQAAVGNQPPVVNAGSNQALSLPTLTTTLAGTVSDDGLPSGATVSKAWTVDSGPGSVTFANASSPTTTVTFSTVGTYTLRLTANDTQYSAYGTVTIGIVDPNAANATLLLHLPFDEGSGSIAHDTTGNGHDGTLINSPTWVAGHLGGAIHFSGATDYVTVPDFPYGPEFSVSFWFKADNAGGTYQYFFSQGTVDVANSLNILKTNASETVYPNHIRTYLLDSTDGAYTNTLDANLPLDSQWHFYTLTVKPGVGSIVYLDANQIAADPNRGGASFDPNSALFLGARNDLSNVRMYAGGLDDVRIHSVALTSAQITALYTAANNVAPTVSAGTDQTITLPAAATLSGAMSDDGKPNPPGLCTSTWSEVSGPGTVTFANASSVSTTATFSTAGTYVLCLTASDSALSATSNVTITVNPPNTLAPVVSIIAAGGITAPTKTLSLQGSVSDDGKPTPPSITCAWTLVSGPHAVVFANPAAATTTVNLQYAGTYVLRLSASDGQLTGYRDVTVTMDGDLSADFNGDGRVDGVDFLVWQSHYPTASGATKATGDTNGDGKVDGVDFLDWQVGYGLWQ
jgi:hypothetical protein